MDVDMRSDHGPARATRRFEVNEQCEEWLITEAWWAERFFPNPTEPVLR